MNPLTTLTTGSPPAFVHTAHLGICTQKHTIRSRPHFQQSNTRATSKHVSSKNMLQCFESGNDSEALNAEGAHFRYFEVGSVLHYPFGLSQTTCISVLHKNNQPLVARPQGLKYAQKVIRTNKSSPISAGRGSNE
jgi:hypothetical protein